MNLFITLSVLCGVPCLVGISIGMWLENWLHPRQVTYNVHGGGNFNFMPDSKPNVINSKKAK